MTGVILTFSITVVLIVAAGTILTWCADAIAEHTGLGKLFVGGIFLAAATSLPELTTGINAIWLGFSNLAVGGSLGSCLFNLLILAGVDLAFRSRRGPLSRVAAAHSLAAMVTIALASVVAIGVLIEPLLSPGTLLGMGPAVMFVLLGYVLGLRLIYLDQQVSLESLHMPTPKAPKVSLATAIFGFFASTVLVFLAAPFLVDSAGQIADRSGLGETFVGSTLLALTTSLPELVATVVAVRIGSADLAVGNIVGSNALNLVVLVPLDMVFPGSLLASVDHIHVFSCLAIILITCVIVAGQLYRTELRFMFIEPDAGLVILLVMVALWILYRVG